MHLTIREENEADDEEEEEGEEEEEQQQVLSMSEHVFFEGGRKPSRIRSVIGSHDAPHPAAEG